MNQLVKWMEDHILPVANILGQIRWLVALRNAFISILPITIAGSIAVLVKSLVDVAQKHTIWKPFSILLNPIDVVCNIVWRGSFSLFGLFLAIALGYQLARTFETDRLASSIVTLSSFMMSVASYKELKIADRSIMVRDVFDISQFSTTGIFTAILFGMIGYAIFRLCIKARLVIHVNAAMPKAQQEAFESLIPVIISLFSVGAINFLFQLSTGTYFGKWLLDSIQKPLVNMGQGFGMVLLITLLIQLFTFLGMNGLGVLAPILDSIWLTAQNVNITAARNGRMPSYTWVRSSFDVFAWFGGTGGTLMLIVSILLFSKRNNYRTVAKVAMAPAIFNINEPVIFGVPVVLNPIFFIPFVVAPLVNVAFSYWITAIGFVNPVQVAVPAIMPPIIGPWLACNYDWRAIILAIVNMLISLLIWTPFVLANDKMTSKEHSRYYYNSDY